MSGSIFFSRTEDHESSSQVELYSSTAPDNDCLHGRGHNCAGQIQEA